MARLHKQAYADKNTMLKTVIPAQAGIYRK